MPEPPFRDPSPSLVDRATTWTQDLKDTLVKTATDLGKAILEQARTHGKPDNEAEIRHLTTEFSTATNSLSDFMGFIEKYNSNAFRNSPELKEDEVQIGIVRTTVPPERITVDEMPNLMEVPGLRTDGTTVIKSGKGRMNIVLELVFNGEDQINNQLRPLIAQFRGYPYVPLVSKFVASIVQPKLQKATPKNAKDTLNGEANGTIVQITHLKDRIVQGIEDLLNQNPDLKQLADEDDRFAFWLNIFRGVSPSIKDVDQSFKGLFAQLAKLSRQTIMKKATGSALSSTQVSTELRTLQKDLLKDLGSLKNKILNLERIRQARSLLEVGGLIDIEEGIIPTCLDQLQVYTVPDRPKLLRARLVLSFFNSGPFGGVLQYRDLRGRPTIDPYKAVFFQKYLSTTWLQPPTLVDPPGDEKYSQNPIDAVEYGRTVPVLGLGEVSDGHPIYDDIKLGYADVPLEGRDKSIENPNEDFAHRQTAAESLSQIKPTTKTLTIPDSSKGVTIRSISTTLANRLSFQCVQGEFYPTVQYMGGKPGFAEVDIVCTNEKFLKQIHDMKMATQRMSNLPYRPARRPEVHIRNSILNLMGIYTAQVENVRTQTLSPNTTQVTLRFVEHRIDAQQREKLIRPTVFSEGKIKAVLEFLVEAAAKYVDGRTRNDIKINKTPAFARKAHNLLYTKHVEHKKPIEVHNPSTAELAVDIVSGAVIGTPATTGLRTILKQSAANKEKARSAKVTSAIYKDVLFKPAVIAEALFLKEAEGVSRGRQISVRKQVLVNAKILTEEQAKKVGSDKKAINDAGGPERLATKIISSWGWGSHYVDQPSRLNSSEETVIVGEGAAEIQSNPPGNLELSLIAAYLVRSSANSSDEIEAVEDAEQGVRVVRKDGKDKTAEIQTVLQLINAIMNNKVVEPGGRSLREIALEDMNLKDFLRRKRTLPSMLYPDLHLPKYRQMLEPITNAIKEYAKGEQNPGSPIFVRPSYKWESLQDPNTKEALSPAVQAYLNVFIPTFKQIGQIPDRPKLQLSDFAYDLDDDILPDFPFFGASTQSLIEEAKEISSKAAFSGDSAKAKRNDSGFIVDENGKTRSTNDPLAQLRHSTNPDIAAKVEEDRKTLKQQAVPALGSDVNTEILTTELYSQGADRSRLIDIGVDTEDTLRRIFKASKDTLDDNLLTMRRCFPTFRLFFIEEDTKEGIWQAIDDVYGYNSVISLNVTRHKHQPDLAEVKLTNLEGNLELDRFGISLARSGGGDPIREKGKTKRTSRANNKATEATGPKEPSTNERTLRKFPLSEGTKVMIQLGYHSNPRFMETVFTGKIAEIQMGDVVTFIAQGYLQELLFPMTENPNTEKTRGVIETVMNSQTVQNFGTWTPYSWRSLTSQEVHNSRTRGIRQAFGDEISTFLADPKFRNVWVSQLGPWWPETWSRLLYQDSWETGGGAKTGWDVINDVISYSPGYVAAVRPYDTGATLFVGRPEQPYFWTDSRQDMHQDWATIEGQRKSKTTDLSAFSESAYFDSVEYKGPEDNALARVPENQRKAKWVSLASTYPKWRTALEVSQKARGLPYNSDSTFPDLRTDRDVGEQLIYWTKTTTLVADYTQTFSMLGRTPEARKLVLRLLAKTLQRGSTILTGENSFITSRQGQDIELRALGIEKTLLLQQIEGSLDRIVSILPRLNNPEVVFQHLWSVTDFDKFRERAKSILSLATFDLDDTQSPVDKKLFEWTIRSAFTAFRASIPLIMRSIRRFVEDNALALSINLNIESFTKDDDRWPLSPRMRPFRNYHMVTSVDDIIDNQMSVSRGAMWNTVAISGASGPPLTIKADDGIIKEDTQLRYFREPNADLDWSNITSENHGGFVNHRFLVGYSRIAQGLRNMYRGQLVLRGRPNIQPWDVIYIYDTFTMTFGPIEVERVTHHFSAETGFVTTIVPHMVSIPNNQVDCWKIMEQGWHYGKVALVSIGAAGTAVGLLGFAIGGAALGAALGIGAAFGAGDIADFIFKEAFGTTLTGLLVGNGQFGGKDTPVKIFPLMRHGAPWVSSIRGWGERNPKTFSGYVFESASKLGKKVEDAAFAFNRQLEKIAIVSDQLSDVEAEAIFTNQDR